MPKNIWTRQFLFILMRPKLFWTSKWTGQKLRSCANHAIVPLSTIGGNKASFKPLLNIIKTFLGRWCVADCYCYSCFVYPFFSFWFLVTFRYKVTKIWKYYVIFWLFCKARQRRKNKPTEHIVKKIKQLMPSSLQILVTSFLVFLSFWLHDFLYLKLSFCLSCLAQ